MHLFDDLYRSILEQVGPGSFCPTEVDGKKCASYLQRCITYVYAGEETAKTREEGGAVIIHVSREDYLRGTVRVAMNLLPEIRPKFDITEPGTFVLLFVLVMEGDGPNGDICLVLPKDAPASMLSDPDDLWHPQAFLQSMSGTIKAVTLAGNRRKCHVCGVEGKTMPCRQCHLVYYCSEACRIKDVVHAAGCLPPPMTIVFCRENTTTPVETVGHGDSFVFRSVARNCFGNCSMNKEPFERLTGASLRVVAGSLGLCSSEPVWYEWGGMFDKPHSRVIEFLECPITGDPDVHFWLEDETGNVYDVVDRYLRRVVAPAQNRTISTEAFAHGCVILGMSKDELKKAGLLYLPADPLVQQVLSKKHERMVVRS